MSKVYPDVPTALEGLNDGDTIMIGGFGMAGQPLELIEGMLDLGLRELTLISNNAGNGDTGLAGLLATGQVRRIICSFPRQHDSWVFDNLYRAGKLELELVPQGNLVARIEAAAAGLGAVYTPVGYGTALAKDKEVRQINGRGHVLEYPLHADFALVKAHIADTYGNLLYRKTARNFGPIMAAAAKTSVVQVTRVVAPGEIDPEVVVTPGIFVQRIVAIGQ